MAGALQTHVALLHGWWDIGVPEPKPARYRRPSHAKDLIVPEKFLHQIRISRAAPGMLLTQRRDAASSAGMRVQARPWPCAISTASKGSSKTISNSIRTIMPRDFGRNTSCAATLLFLRKHTVG